MVSSPMKGYLSDSRISGCGEQLKEHGRRGGCRERMGGGEEEEQWAVATMSCECRIFGRGLKRVENIPTCGKRSIGWRGENENTFGKWAYTYCMAKALGQSLFGKHEILLRALRRRRTRARLDIHILESELKLVEINERI